MPYRIHGNPGIRSSGVAMKEAMLGLIIAAYVMIGIVTVLVILLATV